MAVFSGTRSVFVFIVAGVCLHSHTADAFLPALSRMKPPSVVMARAISSPRSLALSSIRCSGTPNSARKKARQASTSLAAGPVAAMGSMPPVTTKGVILLAVTILLELAGATCMKLSKNFTNPIPSVLLFVFYAASFSLFTVTLQYWPISIAYAIWSGVGTAAMAFIGVGLFAEALKAQHFVGLVLIIAGVIAMNL